jgi:hypothetical protein
MNQSELKELIREVLEEGVTYTSPMYPGQPAMKVGNVYVPITQQHVHYHGPSKPATPEEQAFAYAAIILMGAVVLGVFAPSIWKGIKGKYNQFVTDMKNQKLGETVKLEDLAKEIEAAANSLSPTTKKTVQRMLDDAKNAETPKALGAKISRIRNHIQRYGKKTT